MSENTDEFDKMMSEIMAKEYAKESDQDLLDRKGVIDGISKIIDDQFSRNNPCRSRLRVYGRCIVFHYDCWKNDYYDEPLIGILSAISEQFVSYPFLGSV